MRDSIFLDIDMYSVSSWKGRMGSMLQLLMAQSKLHPIKIGDRSDTDSLPITMEQAYSLNEQWLEARSISFCSYAPEFFLNLYRHLMRPKNREPDHLIMGIELSFLNVEEHVESFLTLCKSLYGWGDMLYGYAAHPKDYKAQTWLPKQLVIGRKLVGAVGQDIREALPGLFWANFFGPAYEAWFGAEKIDTLPCHRVETLPDGGRLVLMSPSPLEYDPSGAAQEAAKHHLGRAAFGDVQRPAASRRSPFQEGLIELPDESKDWPQRLVDLHKQFYGDS